MTARTGLVTAALPRPDRRRPEPLWHQAERSIRTAIDDGAWPSGSRLPGEDRLTELLGVSRITVRHALANLDAAGVVRRERGRGTFVRPARLVAGTRALTSFTDEMAALGLRVDNRVLEVRSLAASERVARALEVEPGAAVVLVRRLRLGDGQAIGVQTAHLRGDRFGGLSASDVAAGSLYALLHQRYGVHPTVAEEVFRVGPASPGDAALLGVGRGSAVFLVERTTSDDRGPFEYTVSTMRGDRYELRSTLRPT